MTKYVEKIIEHLSRPHNEVGWRSDIVTNYAISEEEYIELVDYEVSLINELSNKTYNTLDFNGTGTYDFQFEITQADNSYWKDSPEVFDRVVRIYIDIYPGGIVDIQGETYDVNEDLITDNEYGWEVENELKDIFYTIIRNAIPFINQTKLIYITELYINYP
jgi:hypothetical protein